MLTGPCAHGRARVNTETLSTFWPLSPGLLRDAADELAGPESCSRYMCDRAFAQAELRAGVGALARYPSHAEACDALRRLYETSGEGEWTVGPSAASWLARFGRADGATGCSTTARRDCLLRMAAWLDAHEATRAFAAQLGGAP